jgi:endonuclease-3
MHEARGPQALATIVQRLKEVYPDARYELEWETPLQLLVATILAAQCTDERVNAVTRSLFPKYPDARTYAEADTTGLEEDIRPTGFYRNKAKAIQGACRVLVERFGGKVPRSMEGMLQLPGVARKTANVVLTNAFGIPSGIIVDTHVARVSRRIGLTAREDPDRIEADLMRLLPEGEWVSFGPAMVLHGRYTCTAKTPKCGQCVLEVVCEKRGVSDAEVAVQAPRPAARRAAVGRPLLARRPEVDEGIDDEEIDSPPSRPAARREPAPAAPSRDGGDRRPPGSCPRAGEGCWPRSSTSPISGSCRSSWPRSVVPPGLPARTDVFTAFRLTPYERTSVLLLGQDPIPRRRPGARPLLLGPAGRQAAAVAEEHVQGAAGRSRLPDPGPRLPRSLGPPGDPDAQRGADGPRPRANSHKDRGWETFTDAVIRALDARDDPVVFVLGATRQRRGGSSTGGGTAS